MLLVISNINLCVTRWQMSHYFVTDGLISFIWWVWNDRSYYRCSSSKGCLARKQVEQSCTDHGMFIITYTAEHNHSQPTRRNSLAGTVRQKFPKQEKPDESCTSNSCSPNTPQLQAMDHMNLSQTSMNEEKNYKNDELVIPDFTVDDDFFSGLQDFDEFVSEPSLYDHNSMPQLSVRSCS